jgi:hypothetical protein
MLSDVSLREELAEPAEDRRELLVAKRAQFLDDQLRANRKSV